MNQTKGFLSLFATSIILGFFGVMIRILGNDLQSFQQIVFRASIALIIILIIAVFVLKIKWSMEGIEKKYFLGFCLSFPLSAVFFTLSALQTKIVVSVCALYIGSIFASLVIGKLFFNEKISRVKIFSVILAILGIIFFTITIDFSNFNWGLILGLIAGVFDSIANAFRKFFGGKINRTILVVTTSLGALIVGTILCLFTGQLSVAHISPITIVVGIIFGFCLVAINYLMLIGFQNFDLNLGTVIISLEIPFAAIFSYIIFRESLSIYEILGSLFVASAVALPYLKININPKVK